MTNRVTLTGAEIDYLMSLSDPDASSPARGLLAGLGVAPSATPAQAKPSQEILDAGLASLAVRGFVEVSDGSRLAKSVSGVAEALARPRAAVELGLVAQDTADGALLLDTPGLRLGVAPRAFGTYEITGLSAETDLAVEVESIAQAFLAQHAPGVVAVATHVWPADDEAGPADAATRPAGDAAPASGRRAAIAINAEGEWSFASALDGAAAGPDGEDVAGERMPSALEAWQAFSAALRDALSMS